MMNERNHWWDWLKIVACLAMVIDHLRFVNPAWELWCFIPGRLAMPLFSFIAAQNFMASRNREKYLLRLAPFAILSELPFTLLTGQHGNVLILFLLTFSAIHFGKIWPVIFAGVCSYGFAGVAAIWIFTTKPEKLSSFIGGAALNPFSFGVMSGFASLLPIQEIKCSSTVSFGRNWLLWFYPLHLCVLIGLASIF